MKLIFDDYDGYWVWVNDEDEQDELSPQFDDQHDAIQWQQRMKKIFTGR
jgi:hypothetical protein